MLVLHAHLPYVRHPELPECREESWLFQAAIDCYVPLVFTFRKLLDENIPVRVALSLSPTLLEMWADPLLGERFRTYLERQRSLGERLRHRYEDSPFAAAVAHQCECLGAVTRFFGNRSLESLLPAFLELEHRGALELFTTSATHAFLPAFAACPGALKRQIEVGLRVFERHTGHRSRGFWIPECGYFEGLDLLLAELGIEWTFVDAHSLKNASSPVVIEGNGAAVCPSGVVVFGRDEATARQVWSAEEGFPAAPVYRDYHRDAGYELPEAEVAPFLWGGIGPGMTGFKLHRITGHGTERDPYDPVRAADRTQKQAEDFAAALRDRGLVTALYDAELFGHWWHEGPLWLEAVVRKLSVAGIRAVSPGDWLREPGPLPVLEPDGGSWGEGGYGAMWLNPSNDWILPEVLAAERRLESLDCPPGPEFRRALAQAVRELMLAGASDWPFMLTNGTCTVYAEQRVRGHLGNFYGLLSQISAGVLTPGYLDRLEHQNPLYSAGEVLARPERHGDS